MFCISYPKQEEVVKDLKIILDIKNSEEHESKSLTEFFVNSSNAFLLSPIISTNTQTQGTLSIFKQDITIKDDQTFSKDLFISLLESLFSNDPIKYTEKNYSILHKISKIFGIDKLKTSIERYQSYLDRINDFTVGRLSIIDLEFLCQLYLQNLNQSNIEDTRNASNRFITEFGPEFFSYILFRCFYSNFSNSPLYLTFIVHEIPNSYYIEFVKSLERLFRFGSSARCNCDDSLSLVNCLIRFFLEKKLINYDDREIFAYKCGCRGYTYQFFDYEHGDVHRDPTYYVYRHYDEISKDNFSLHRKLVLNGKNQDPLFQLIEKDDVDSLQNYLAFNPDKTVDSIIEDCYYEARPEFQYYSFNLLEIAAYFGSVKIFKYLILNKAGIRNEQLSKMAIYGGNAEIIRICKQKDISFKPVRTKNNDDLLNVSYLQIAIKMNHLDILRWLIEEEKNDINKDDIDIVGYALQVANFEAYYYLVSVLYDIKNNTENKKENEEEFKFKFDNVLKCLVYSYNLPIMKNYLHLKNYELLEFQKYSYYFYDKYFNDIFLGNYDIEIIDLLLESNKLKNLETIPRVCMSSLSYQKFARYLITHENVTYDDDVIVSIRNNLLYPDHSLLSNLNFVQDQIQLLFDISSNPIDKLSLLPLLFKYNLFDNYFSQKYKDLITKSSQPLKIPPEIFDILIKYVDIDMIKLIYNYADKKCIKKCYSFDSLADAINKNKIDIVLYLLSSSEVPFSSIFKFSDKSFFILFYSIQKIEDLNKLFQLYSNKRIGFYKNVFLPNVLYNLNDKNEEVTNYILNLPEIEPFINKENKKYKNLPPLLYQNESSLFWSNEKFDINIRQSETNKNLLSFLHDKDKIKKLLSIEKFEYNVNDVMMCIQENGYPYSREIFEIFLNGLLFEKENQIKIELNFNDDQINQLFGMICINDNRLDISKQFYSKYSDRIDINYLNPKNNGLVILDAIDNNAIETVKFLINIKDIDLNKRGDSGKLAKHNFCCDITPFCFAVDCEEIEIVKLFENKCDRFNVNETYTDKIFFYYIFFNEITCLHTAAKYDNIWLIRFLLNLPNINKNAFDKV